MHMLRIRLRRLYLYERTYSPVDSNKSGARTVYMADTEWSVIGYGESTDGNGQVANRAGTMTLISKDKMDATIFDCL